MDVWSRRGTDPPGFRLQDVGNGKDVIATKHIKKGSFVLKHCGTVLTASAKKMKLLEYTRRKLTSRFLDIQVDGKKMSIDSTLSGQLGCRIREDEGGNVIRRINNRQVTYHSLEDIFPGDVICCKIQKTFLKVEDNHSRPMLKVMEALPDPEIFTSRVQSVYGPAKKTVKDVGFCEICKQSYTVLTEHLKCASHADNFLKLSTTIEQGISGGSLKKLIQKTVGVTAKDMMTVPGNDDFVPDSEELSATDDPVQDPDFSPESSSSSSEIFEPDVLFDSDSNGNQMEKSDHQEVPHSKQPTEQSHVDSDVQSDDREMLHEEVPHSKQPTEQSHVDSDVQSDDREMLHEEVPKSTRTTDKRRVPCSDQMPNKKRKYSKPKRPCPFCLTEQVQLRRHLRTVHRKEPIILATEKLTPKARTKEYDRLRKKAIFAVNQKRILQNEPLYRERSQGNCELVICSLCRGFYESKFMSRHHKICSGMEEHSTSFPSKKLNILKYTTTSKLKNEPLSRFDKEILSTFKDDSIGRICQKDQMLKIYGNKEWNTSGKTNRNSVMSNMRALGSLLVQVKMETKDEALTGEDMLDRTKFKYVELAVRSLTENESEEKSALKLKIGYALKGAAQAMAGFYSMDSDPIHADKKARDIELFMFVLNHNWGSIFQSAQKKMAIRRCTVLRKPNQLPLESDMMKLKNKIEEDINEVMNDPYLVWGQTEFTKIRSRTLTRLTLYNARRGGEPARLLLSEFQAAQNEEWVDDSIEINDPMEKALVGKHLLAHQAGKGGRRLVPILIPKDILPALTKLIEVREQCSVVKENPYVFSYTQGSLEHCRGWDAVNEVCSCSDLQEPEKITATTVRHRASTYYALLDVNPTERKWFLNHMGHTEEVSSNIYTHPPSYMEMCKVGKFFDALDKGKVLKSPADGNCPQTQAKAATTVTTETSASVEEMPSCPRQDLEKTQSNLRKTDVTRCPPATTATTTTSTEKSNTAVEAISPITRQKTGQKESNLRKTVAKVMWKPAEVVAVLDFFHKNIISETVPSKQQVDVFFKHHFEIEKACNGNWRRIKYKVYNEILRRKTKK